MGKMKMGNGEGSSLSEVGYGYIQITEIPSDGHLFAFGGSHFGGSDHYSFRDCDQNARGQRGDAGGVIVSSGDDWDSVIGLCRINTIIW